MIMRKGGTPSRGVALAHDHGEGGGARPSECDYDTVQFGRTSKRRTASYRFAFFSLKISTSIAFAIASVALVVRVQMIARLALRAELLRAGRIADGSLEIDDLPGMRIHALTSLVRDSATEPLFPS